VDLTHPAWQSAIVAAIAAACFWKKRYAWSVSTACLAIAWLWLCATPAFAQALLGSLTAAFPAHSAEAYPAADAIVVLGGGFVPSSAEAWQREPSKARASRIGIGLGLFKARRAPYIVLSGGGHEALQMADRLVEQGVPRAAIMLEPLSTNTHENAAFTRAILARRGAHSVLVVTSPFHMARAVASFRHEGLAVSAAPAGEAGIPDRAWVDDPWLPRRDALRATRRYVREYLARWAYECVGWA
jgi:uncharacterized SAM-binding protein YcdF (DUF218 family)